MFNRILFLSIVAALGVISASLCAPALPYIADHFSAHFSEVQFTISLFLVGNAFGQLVSGPLSDQIGQKKVLIGGLCLYILASCSCAVSTQMSLLLIARFFQGMGSSVGPVLARAITANTFPQQRSAQIQSYGAIGVGVASMLAILCSGQLTLASWRGNFWLAASLGIVLLTWACVALKKPTQAAIQKIKIRDIFLQMKQVVQNAQFLGAAACHSMTYGLMYGYIALFPFLLLEFFKEKNPVQVGLYSAYMIACYMVGALLVSRWVLRFSSYRLVLAGVSLQLFAGLVLAFSHSSLFCLIGLSIFNLSVGVILPLTSASALAPFVGKRVGTASSSLGLSYRVIGSILSILICQFPLAGGRSLGWVMCLLSLGSLFIVRRSMSKDHPKTA